jgi:hypothetical protein
MSAMAMSFTGPAVLNACPHAAVPRPPQPISAMRIVSSTEACALRAMPNVPAKAPDAATIDDVFKKSRRDAPDETFCESSDPLLIGFSNQQKGGIRRREARRGGNKAVGSPSATKRRQDAKINYQSTEAAFQLFKKKFDRIKPN